MRLEELNLNRLGIIEEKYGRILTVVDYGNVNYWYERDSRDYDGNDLMSTEKLIVDIEKLASFISEFSKEKRFYYWNPRRQKNWHITIKAEKCGFIKITKPMQFIRHYLSANEIVTSTIPIRSDSQGRFIEIPKSNFDVEISVDAMRRLEKYDTFCLFSGDSDFAYLARYLKKQGKKIIVFASGQVFFTLKEIADLYVNAQSVKQEITKIKKTTPREERGLDIRSASGGQGGNTLMDKRLT